MYDEDSSLPGKMEPAAVVQSFDAAWNTGNADHVLRLFAPDAVVRFMYPPPFPEPDTYTGREEIRRLLESYFSGKFRIQSAEPKATINQMTWQYRMAADHLHAFGVQELDGSAGATFKDGMIEHLTISFSPESTARLQAGLDRAGIGGPISEALAEAAENPAALAGAAENLPEAEVDADEVSPGSERPNRGPTWDAVGGEER